MKAYGRVLRILALAAVLITGCGTAAAPGQGESEVVTLEQARWMLRRSIEDVREATTSRYGLKDDLGNGMDALKVIVVPESGGFAGVYHTFREDTQAFHVHLATSQDLLSWRWRVELAANASQATLQAGSDGGFVAAWEQELDNHLKFAHYESWADLLEGTPGRTFDAPRRFSTCAEGTPNLYSASSTQVEAGFHFFAYCDLDRQARGTTDWESWHALEQPELDRAVLSEGVLGSIGDRDTLEFEGYPFTLIEGQLKRGDWSTWKIYLYDGQSGKAEALDIRTDSGSSSFTNPTIAVVEIGGKQALLVTLFLPQEGAGEGETGQLIYYRIFQPVSR